MNKATLIETIASKTELTKKDVETVVRVFTDVVTDALADGDKVQLVGFGTFDTVTRAARTGRNPKTGESISIPESKAPKFKAAKTLKEAVNS